MAPPKQGAASTPKPCMGDPARLGDEGRAMPRETLAGAARGRGKGPATHSH
ncbi:hypothetical protein TCARB_1783 [Thermofilum adornatum 1505]|uniref:Uncharacterized protein n=1 Tax=Thermofilum adornatum 1505 TaxID=697581 RepID=A0A3G1A783_9CREN|nr:hypothetical protein TCARB_1783 [Thermofilum adornatum 1505]